MHISKQKKNSFLSFVQTSIKQITIEKFEKNVDLCKNMHLTTKLWQHSLILHFNREQLKTESRGYMNELKWRVLLFHLSFTFRIDNPSCFIITNYHYSIAYLKYSNWWKWHTTSIIIFSLNDVNFIEFYSSFCFFFCI